MSVVGFDFGSESCKIAVARRKAIDVLQNEVGNRKTASFVGFADRLRLVGDEAAAQAMGNSHNTIVYVKRFLGVSFDDPLVAKEAAYVPFKLVPVNGKVGFELSYNGKKEVFSAEQITAALLQRLKGTAERGLEHQRVTDCVLACPSWWTETQRRALLDAAEIAGLNVLRLMNETTAVALNYGILRPLPKDEASKVMFVDIGATTTTATVASFVQGGLKILSTASDPFLGGRDIDGVLVEHFHQYILTKYKIDVLSNEKAKLKLWKECERVKRMLSAGPKVVFNVEYIMNDIDVKGEIDRNTFNELCQKSLIPRVVAVLQRALAIAGVQPTDLHSIEVIGGAPRVPILNQSLASAMGHQLSWTCDSDESIARGAALQCAMLSPSFKVREFEVHDLCPTAMQVQWGPDRGDPEHSAELFPVNTPIPYTKLISFTDRTQPFQLVVRYSDPKSILGPLSTPIIGKYVISGMPGARAGKKAPKVKVRLQLSLHGTVAVNAQLVTVEEIKEDKPAAAAAPAAEEPKAGEPTKMDTTSDDKKDPKAEDAKKAQEPKTKVTREELKVAVSHYPGLNRQAITAAAEREAAIAAQDQVIAETNAERNSLEGYCLEMRGKVEDELSEYVPDEVRAKFLQDCSECEEWLYDAGADAQRSEVKARLKGLRDVGEAAKRRAFEFTNREEALLGLKNAIGRWEKLAASEEEKYSHIDKDERKKVTDATAAADQLLSTDLGKQAKLAKHVDPVITVADIHSRTDALNKLCASIMNKAKPKPEPKPEAKEAKQGEAKQAEAAKPEEPKADGAKPGGETPAPEETAKSEAAPEGQPKPAEDDLGVD